MFARTANKGTQTDDLREMPHLEEDRGVQTDKVEEKSGVTVDEFWRGVSFRFLRDIHVL